MSEQKETFPPTPPYKENRTRTRTGSGSGTGTGVRAREASRPGSGSVDFVKVKGSGTAVKIDRDFILSETYDPVQVALAVLRIPKASQGVDGKQYNNSRIMRWYIRIIGEDAFRDLVYRQWRENAIDGEPRNRSAAFMAKLWKFAFPTKGGAA